nr:MAG TPA: hypothetical protein [Caudoviricetes sp.]
MLEAGLSFLDWYRMPFKDFIAWREIVVETFSEIQKEQKKAFNRKR